MKKFIKGLFVLFIPAFFCSTHGYGQNVYYDAISLRQLKGDNKLFPIDDATKRSMATILRNYLPEANKTDTGVGQVLNYFFKHDKFISDLIDPNFQQGTAGGAKSGSLGTLIQKAGSLDVTTIADGLAKFLVERAKEELSLAFFEKFKSDMEKPEFADLRILFPQTYSTLKLIDTRIYQYSAYLTELREAFIADLKDLGYNVPVALQTGTIHKYFDNHPELKTAISLASQVTDLFVHKTKVENLGTLIENLGPDHFFNGKSYSDSLMNGGIKLLQLISGSFKSGDTTRYWIPGDSLSNFLGDAISVRLYLGLLYPNADTVRFGSDAIKLRGIVNFQIMLDGVAAHFNDRVVPLSNGIRDFTALISNYDDYRKYKQRKGDKDTSALYYYSIYTKTADAIVSGIGLVKSFDPSFNPEFVKFLPAIKTIGDIYINAEQNKFSLAVLSLVKLLGQLKDSGYDSKLLQKVATYGSFAAEVGQAKTSDEVKDIITQTVLPVGSSSIKKNSRFNIAINAYLGGFFGRERIADNLLKPWANSLGVTAPIGVAFSWPLRFSNCSWGSISAYGSLFDLGAVASFRLKDTSTEKLPKLTLQNIFAPGLGAIWGLPKVPLSIGYIYQWGPQLREITATDADLKSGSLNKRWFFFLAVDIPLLNIFNKPR